MLIFSHLYFMPDPFPSSLPFPLPSLLSLLPITHTYVLFSSEIFESKSKLEIFWDFPSSSVGKEPACQCRRCKEMWVWTLGQENPLKKEMATHSSILAWENPWTEEPDGLQPTESQRVRHNLTTKPSPPSKREHPLSCPLKICIFTKN